MGDILESLQLRRSIYTITDEMPYSDERLEKLIGKAVQETPTAFNMQSPRVVLLLGDNHKKLWSMTLERLRPETPPENFGRTQQKIEGFSAGHGTILYFDDTTVTKQYAENNPLYADSFPVWAQQQNGMLQLCIWTLLAESGIGATLQHYNPLIDEDVYKTWNIPSDWKLVAQMPFGKKVVPADAKDYEPLETRMKVFR